MFDWYSACCSSTNFCVLNAILFSCTKYGFFFFLFPVDHISICNPFRLCQFYVMELWGKWKCWHGMQRRGHPKRIKQFHLPNLLFKKHCQIQREAECEGQLVERSHNSIKQHSHTNLSKVKFQRLDETVFCTVVVRCVYSWILCASVCEALSSGHIALAQDLNATLCWCLKECNGAVWFE